MLPPKVVKANGTNTFKAFWCYLLHSHKWYDTDQYPGYWFCMDCKLAFDKDHWKKRGE